VFSKIGDSATVNVHAFHPIGWGEVELYQYDYLMPVIEYFSFARARDANSFAAHSLAAGSGWTTLNALRLSSTNEDGVTYCRLAEAPLLCEYRVARPSIALIMLGTNDVVELSGAAYRRNMRFIIRSSIEQGIIPVLSTLPVRIGYETEVTEFNEIIKSLSAEFEVPLWDYGLAMESLPNHGLAEDGIHPSAPPEDSHDAAKFSPENLQYGYTLRNLTALHVLDTLWREVLFD
jgi:hypothetical protein